jgi:hypothetical protein
MSLFLDAAITEYSDRVSGLLTNYTLYNRSAFHAWYTPPPLRSTARSIPVDIDKLKLEEAERREIAMGVLVKLAGICSDIGTEYGEGAIRSAINAGEDKYDILVAIDERIGIGVGTTQKTSQDKLRAIAGFIVVEKGECEKRTNSWCVNLICVTPGRVKGSLLLGACLYCIAQLKNDPSINQECLLELAGGYNNLPGFFSYTAMGFLRDDSLWGEDCLHEENCMPMRANLSTVSSDDIVNKVLGTAPKLVLSIEEDPSGLWNRKCYAAKYKNNDGNPVYTVLQEIQTIGNLTMWLTLSGDDYVSQENSTEGVLYKDYKDHGRSTVEIIGALQELLPEKLDNFDSLTNSSTATRRGLECNILGGRGRKRSRGKSLRGRRSRGKKSRSRKTRGLKTRRRKYYNPK